jgi:acyl-CoA thioester hydrolase
MMKLPEALAGYHFAIPETVVWGDMDAMRHVNNTQYFRYMETARIGFIHKLFPHLEEPSGATNMRVGLALAEARCRFKISLTYPDEIIVSAGIREIQEKQFIVQHEIYSTKLDCIAAEGDARMVCFDFIEKCQTNIPADSVAALQAHSILKP